MNVVQAAGIALAIVGVIALFIVADFNPVSLATVRVDTPAGFSAELSDISEEKAVPLFIGIVFVILGLAAAGAGTVARRR